MIRASQIRSTRRSSWLPCILLLPCIVTGRAAGQTTSPDLIKPNDLDWIGFSADEARKSHPVELEGIVLCYDFSWNQFYVSDQKSATYLSPKAFTNRFNIGQHVKIHGLTTWDGLMPVLTNTSVENLGQMRLPAAVPLKISELRTLQGQWIQTVGEVRIAEASRGRITLVLRDGKQTCFVYILETTGTNAFRQFADCQVSVRGINGSRIVGNQLEAAIFCPSLDFATVTLKPNSPRWAMPVTSVETAVGAASTTGRDKLVHLNGLVRSCVPGASVTLQDPTGIISAKVTQLTQVAAGQRIDLWGYCAFEHNAPSLIDASFEVLGPNHSERPRPKARTPQLGESALTNISQIRMLSREKADENLPVSVSGVVTFADPHWHVTFVQDAKDAVFVDTGETELISGQFVKVTAQTDGSGFAPGLLNASVEVLGVTNLPVPIKASLRDAADGHLDSEWVEMEGVVHHATDESGRLELKITGYDGSFDAVVFDSRGLDTARLIDSLVSIRGACGSSVNTRGQISGVTLHVPSQGQIAILDAGPGDPFGLPTRSISSVATFNPNQITSRRLKITGVVSLVMRKEGFYLQDHSGGLRVPCQITNELKAGDCVEVTGFPAFSEHSPCVDEAVYRVIRHENIPAAKKTTALDILRDGVLGGQEIELSAQVLQSQFNMAQRRLVLQDGPIIFTAQALYSAGGGSISELEPGCIARVRGVCAMQWTDTSEPESFRVFLRSAGDVAEIEGAPWWTPRHWMFVLSGVAASFVIAGSWVIALRRRVRAQTEIIREKQKELLDVSRRAGMAEVATSVLHNVGNVLNSVNVSATIVADKVKNSSVSSMERACGLLQEHRADLGTFVTDHPKGRHLPTFISAVTEDWRAETDSLRKEVESLRHHIDHVNEIVSMQQNFATAAGIVERVKPREVVEDALLMNSGAAARHEISIVREYDESVGFISVERHKLLQILVNLVNNAKHACVSCDEPGREIRLGVKKNADMVRISVVDNGTGIKPEHLPLIFNFGFTTRPNGHGFGLHSSAIAATEMGGRLAVKSDGPGKGACFTLDIPCSATLKAGQKDAQA